MQALTAVLRFSSLSLIAAGILVSDAFPFRSSFDTGWKAFKGNPANAQSASFDDAAWEAVDVPHDFMISGTPTQSAAGEDGFFPKCSGWYRKHFSLSAADSGKKIFIEFDMATGAKVYVNGTDCGAAVYPYVPFNVDATPYVKFGADNLIAVSVSSGSSRWYVGAGILRHTYLKILDKVHIDWLGTYITTPTITTASASVVVKTTVRNAYAASHNCVLRTAILDVDGAEVASTETTQSVPQGAASTVQQNLSVASPRLWDIRTPYLYTAVSKILLGGTVVDSMATTFGIRTIAWDANRGILLNGRNVKIYGINLHHDLGIFGGACNERGWERHLHTMKSVGYFGIRVAHCPREREFYDLCDRTGFLVMDEFFDRTSYLGPRLEIPLKCHRNHPSIYAWSFGNEGPDYALFNQAWHWADTVDDRRFLYGNGYDAGITGLCKAWGVGYSTDYTGMRSSNPDAVFQSCEQFVYYNPYTLDQMDDNRMAPANPWPLFKSVNYLFAFHYWAGLEYIGESFAWPGKTFNGTPLDINGFRKPVSFMHQANVAEDPMVHITVVDPRVRMTGQSAIAQMWYFPNMGDHWTHPIMQQGNAATVQVYSNCPSVELFINDVSQGMKNRTQFSDSIFKWSINYAPGTIRAIGKIDGREACRHELRTAGAPSSVILTPDRNVLLADGLDRIHVEATVVGANGTRVPDAAAGIDLTMSVTGPARIVAKGNGDIWGDFRTGKAYDGRVLIVLQSTGQPGAVTLTVGGSGLANGQISLQAASERVEVPYLFGTTRNEAESRITARGLVVGSVTQECHASVPAGQVMYQTPAYGMPAGKGCRVNLTVSRGPFSAATASPPRAPAATKRLALEVRSGAVGREVLIRYDVPVMQTNVPLSVRIVDTRGRTVATPVATTTRGGSAVLRCMPANQGRGVYAVHLACGQSTVCRTFTAP